jgi:hypothetical protein
MVGKRRKKHGLKILTIEEQQRLIDEMEPLSDLDAYAPTRPVDDEPRSKDSD